MFRVGGAANRRLATGIDRRYSWVVTTQPSVFRSARRSFWLLFGGIWLLVGLIFLAFSIAFALHEFEYTTSGATASGIVLAKDFVPARSDSSTQYRVRYRFTTATGEVFEGSDGVSLETWEGLQERAPVEIRYLPSRPGSNRLALGGDSVLWLAFLLVGLIAAGAGAVVFVRALRGVLRGRRLLRLGRSSVATVTRIDETRVTVNRRQQFKVRYSYRDQHDRTHQGDSGYLGWDEATGWKPGDRVAIRFDPDQPEQSVWIGQRETAPQPATVVDAPPPISSPPA